MSDRAPVVRPAQVGRGYRFIDLFAGVGGFHQALHNLGAKCVFASEIDDAARETYEHNFKKSCRELFRNDGQFFNRDIKEITELSSSAHRTGRGASAREEALRQQIDGAIPDFDVLCAGFPCQPFSQAGHKLGFGDARGNLFYDIAKIIEAKEPRAIFLENVRHLQSHSHNGVRTIEVIRSILDRLGYGEVEEFIVRASDHGVPQHRPRIFIIGFRDADAYSRFERPQPRELKMTMSKVFRKPVTNADGTERRIGFTLRVGGKSSPIDDRRNWDGYWVDGSPKRLTYREGLKMQGFNEDFEFPSSVSSTERMKQLGNSVAVPAIQDYAEAMFRALGKSK